MTDEPSNYDKFPGFRNLARSCFAELSSGPIQLSDGSRQEVVILPGEVSFANGEWSWATRSPRKMDLQARRQATSFLSGGLGSPSSGEKSFSARAAGLPLEGLTVVESARRNSVGE